MGGFPTTILDWLIVMSIGVLGFIGQATLTIGLQIEAAGLLSLMRKAFSLIFNYTFQVTLFKVNRASIYKINIVIIRILPYTNNLESENNT